MERVESMSVKPVFVVNGKQTQSEELREIVHDTLAVISLRDLSGVHGPDSVVKRNSFRDLHSPDISFINWVVEAEASAESNRKEEVPGYI